MRSYSPFFEIFADNIQKLVEAGFCPHRLAGIITSSRRELYEDEIPPLVLSMDDLGVGFEVCLIPLALSLLVFVSEVIYSKVRKTVKDYLTALFAVVTFLKISRPGI